MGDAGAADQLALTLAPAPLQAPSLPVVPQPSAPTAAVRSWAVVNGYAVSDRGRLPAEVRQAYAAAHPTSS